MDKFRLRIAIFRRKVLQFITNITNLLTSSSINNPKRTLSKYLLYLLIVIGINFIVGKNITNVNYAWYTNVSIFFLVNLNVIIILFIMLMIFRITAKIIAERSDKKFGSRLKSKVIIFSMIISVIPSFFIFTFAVTVINVAINKWFNAQIDYSLSSSLNILKDYEGLMIDSLNLNVISLIDISDDNNVKIVDLLDTYIDNDIFSGAAVYDTDKKKVFYAKKNDTRDNSTIKINSDTNGLNDENVDENISSILSTYLDSMLLYEKDTGIDQLNNKTFYWLSYPIDEKRFLIAYKLIPSSIELDINSINILKSIRSESKYFSYPVKNSYLMLMVVLFLIVVFSALWGSVLFANSITKPIEELADASVLISGGNLDIKVNSTGGSEISYLIDTFNNMTSKLKEHTNELNSKNVILSETYNQILIDKMYIDAIFKNVLSMIILMKKDLTILEMNEKADLFISNGEEYFKKHILAEISEFLRVDDKQSISNISFTLDGKPKIYLMNISSIFTLEEEQLLIVLDDVTDIVTSQRFKVWKEVATRIAHEVKNPLTPIKLMAERVNKRIAVLEDTEIKGIVTMSMDTIVSEVESLLELVEEFSYFAREKVAHKVAINLGDEILNTVHLYERSYPNVRFNYNFDKDCAVTIYGDKLQIKRILQNLITNSISAMKESGEITIALEESTTDIAVIIDDTGGGIPEKDIGNVFNPYFSKRSGGTGLGLAIVKKVIDEHQGSIEAKNLDKGARFIIKVPKKLV